MKNLHKSKYDSEGRPIKKNTFNINNLNSFKLKKLPKKIKEGIFIVGFLILLERLIPEYKLILLPIIIISSVFIFINTLKLTKDNILSDYIEVNSNNKLNDKQEEIINEFQNEELDFNEVKADNLIKEFNYKK